MSSSSCIQHVCVWLSVRQGESQGWRARVENSRMKKWTENSKCLAEGWKKALNSEIFNCMAAEQPWRSEPRIAPVPVTCESALPEMHPSLGEASPEQHFSLITPSSWQGCLPLPLQPPSLCIRRFTLLLFLPPRKEKGRTVAPPLSDITFACVLQEQ